MEIRNIENSVRQNNAEKFWEEMKSGKMGPVFFGQKMAASILGMVCDELAKKIETTIADTNEYVLDVDVTFAEFNATNAEIEAKIKKIEAEIASLQNKEKDGTITEEEKSELGVKTAELESLRAQSAVSSAKQEKEASSVAGKLKENETLLAKGKDYGDTAIEKGKPMMETQDKHKSFWRKLFGTWNNQDIRDSGKKLVDSGENLLSKVDSSIELNKTVADKTKKTEKKSATK